MLSQSIDSAKSKMEQTISFVSSEIGKIRTGRANPDIFNKILVSYYDNDTPLNQVANIAALDAITISIQPFDKTIIDDIDYGNAPKISPDGNMITFMVLEDDGYQITSGDIYLWDSRTGKTDAIADDPKQIGMNPIWMSDHLIYYIDLRDGSLNKVLLEGH